MKKKIALCLAGLGLTVGLVSARIFAPLSAESEKITLTLTQVAGGHNEMVETAKRILSEAYNNIGINIIVEEFPSERALNYSNKGLTDGELLRVDNIHLKYTQLIKIPVAYMSIRHMAWTKDLDFTPEGWKSLKPFKIGFHRGYKLAENATEGMNRQTPSSFQQVFKMLNQGRFEVAIATEYPGLNAIRELNLNGIKMLQPPLEITPVYHYLNKKHEHLLERITDSLKKMQQDGRFEQILSQVESEFKNSDVK